MTKAGLYDESSDEDEGEEQVVQKSKSQYSKNKI